MPEKTIENLDQKEPKMYEMSYLMVPLVAEDEKTNVMENDIVGVIKSAEGQVSTSSQPEMKKLAYTIRKMINNKYSKFSDAYFGFVKFQITPDKIKQIDDAVKKSDNILRHLLIEAPKLIEEKKVKKEKKATEEVAEIKEKKSEVEKKDKVEVVEKEKPATVKVEEPAKTEAKNSTDDEAKKIDKEIDNLLS